MVWLGTYGMPYGVCFYPQLQTHGKPWSRRQFQSHISGFDLRKETFGFGHHLTSAHETVWVGNEGFGALKGRYLDNRHGFAVLG